MMLIVALVLAAFVSALAGCGGHWGDDEEGVLPTGNAANRVDQVYARAPDFMVRAVGRTERAVFTEVLVQDPAGGRERFRLMIDYGVQKQRIYDETRAVIFAYAGVTTAGDHVIRVSEYVNLNFPPASVIFVNGEWIPEIQSFPYQHCGVAQAAPIVDIREIGDGWLVLRAQSSGRGWQATFWSAYHPQTRQLVRYGEIGPSQLPLCG